MSNILGYHETKSVQWAKAQINVCQRSGQHRLYDYASAQSRPPMIGFGEALKRYRDERGLSLRELDKLSGVNYAYIQRLESNDKTAPSDDKIDALCNALKLSPQRRGILRSLLATQPVPDALFEAMLRHPVATVDAFLIASRVSFRGSRPTSPEDWIVQLDDIDVNILQNRDH